MCGIIFGMEIALYTNVAFGSKVVSEIGIRKYENQKKH